MSVLKLESKYQPAGDQPEAINRLVSGLKSGKANQILLGVTGSGKTYTVAQIIQKTQRPAVIMAHNKILAAQLYSEMKAFFPHNAVEYFISYFDYYQPEAYVPGKDIYIDKDSVVNPKLEQMKLSAIYSLLERRDTIVVCSVSSIYGIQSKANYQGSQFVLRVGDDISFKSLTRQLTAMQYHNATHAVELTRGSFRVKGDIVEIFPAHFEEHALKLSFFGDHLESITLVDTLTGKKLTKVSNFKLYAANLFATAKSVINQSIPKIEQELKERVEFFNQASRFVEAQRIYERTKFDLEMLATTGHCKGIEHYSRYLSNLQPGQPPFTMFDYLPKDTLLFVDESHVSLPQLRAMYSGDFKRKSNLAEYGFRLPSCVDNRPLTFEEWDERRPQTIFVSATPADYELNLTGGEVVEQIIRPTGLLDPACILRPQEHQLDDFMVEATKTIEKGFGCLAITLTKKMAMRVTDYLNENGFKAKYLHSDIDTFERVEIIKGLRNREFDILVGINLLREGLDLPECALVAIFDADKEGFLRSRTSLIQTIGRAARNSLGRVILYASTTTKSLQEAIDETSRRRAIQAAYNEKHNITPTTVKSHIANLEQEGENLNDSNSSHNLRDLSQPQLLKYKNQLEKEMRQVRKTLNFELAIELREQLKLIDLELLSR